MKQVDLHDLPNVLYWFKVNAFKINQIVNKEQINPVKQ